MLETLRTKQKAKIEELKTKTGFYETKGLIDRYDSSMGREEKDRSYTSAIDKDKDKTNHDNMPRSRSMGSLDLLDLPDGTSISRDASVESIGSATKRLGELVCIYSS